MARITFLIIKIKTATALGGGDEKTIRKLDLK